ncbi:MAG: FG-GAP repeat protein [Planctomycetota bacterium]
MLRGRKVHYRGVLLGGVAAAVLVYAQTGVYAVSPCLQTQVAKLTGNGSDYFGGGVAISGNAIAVGASWDADKGGQAGAMYIFRNSGSGWVQEAKLTASDGSGGDHLGQTVAISGNVAVAGARYKEAAYVFRFNGSTWSQDAKLTASDGVSGDYFGSSVGVSGDTLVVGSQWDDNERGTNAGSAYVFHYNGSAWVQTQKLLASDGASGDQFSAERSLCISDDLLVVGATPNDNANGADAGAAYVFRFSGSTWGEEAKLIAPGGAVGDGFGTSLGISGNAIVVGAGLGDGAVADSGAAYVFRYSGSGWAPEAKLYASDGALQDSFGISVAIDTDTVIVGAHADDDLGTSSGSAYIFRHAGSSWGGATKVTASDGSAGAFFGASLALQGSTAVVGAGAGGPGAAYVYNLVCDIPTVSAWGVVVMMLLLSCAGAVVVVKRRHRVAYT